MTFENIKIKPLIPYLGTLVVILGYIKLGIYYNHFNISILNYLELSEILSLYLHDIVKYSILMFITFFVDFLLTETWETKLQGESTTDIINTANAWKRFLKFNKNKPLFPIFVILSSLILILSLLLGSNFEFFLKIFILFLFIYLFVYLLLEFKRKYKLVYGNEFNGTYNNLIILSVIWCMYMFVNLDNEINQTKNQNPIYTCFQFQDKIYQTDETLVFVGQTKGYFFLFDKTSNETFIFNRSDIKNLVFRANN